ncbi:phosphoribosyl-AMP cyclohydrolase [Thiomicrospira microaerophila]|uniref:phosphoribosyl-AMP cyclohydrolase n=1 Tax=Thiomicrospira microaerophila TaxID=406020 RepID=UPI0020103304|nr:phosphoribosyl-AMP cyclohydrolase [Thiomicrospira microaerophila]UQB42484.1 phosphoribosyl-AMP cyclohydrolase [Thiomicrospira microaerophila]
MNFLDLEKAKKGDQFDWSDFKDQLKFDQDGLMPAIAQQYDTGEVLMLAYMNLTALEETLTTGRVCYWSRSRQSFWRKGEASGQIQQLKEARLDCDGDTLLLQVDQTGPACHTGRSNCFYNGIKGDKIETLSDPLIDPAELYKHSH